VPPARHTIGIPSCRATGVAAIHENAIAPKMMSAFRSSATSRTSAATRRTQR
jgi:hypothetical protein